MLQTVGAASQYLRPSCRADFGPPNLPGTEYVLDVILVQGAVGSLQGLWDLLPPNFPVGLTVRPVGFRTFALGCELYFALE